MTDHSRFPEGLIWRPDGHVSDWVLSALVDGEALALPDEAVVHTDSCEHCATRLGDLASQAFALGEDLALWSEHQAQQAPFPVRALGVAGVLIALGLAGSVGAGGTEWTELPHRLLTLWRWGRVLAPWASERLDLLSFALGWLGVLMALAAGLIFARRTSLSSEQEPLS